MHALRNIHSALTPAGLLVDTQPVGPQPRVTINGVEAGSLDMLDQRRPAIAGLGESKPLIVNV